MTSSRKDHSCDPRDAPLPFRCEWTSSKSSLLQRCQETVISRSKRKSTGITLLDRGQFRRHRCIRTRGVLERREPEPPRLKLLACTYPICVHGHETHND